MKSYLVHYETMEHTVGPIMHRQTHLEITPGGDERAKLQDALKEFLLRPVLLVGYEQQGDPEEEAEFFLTAADWI